MARGLRGVDVDQHPRSRQPATTSATGWSVPTSWLPHCTWTSAVSGRMASSSVVDVDAAVAVAADERHVVTERGQPHRGVLDRRGDDVVAASVAPNTAAGDGLGGATGEHDLAAASAEQGRDLLAGLSTAARAVWPSRWIRLGSPPTSADRSQSTMASTASGRVGDVEAWSR